MQREETYQRQYSKKPETVKHKLSSKGRQLQEHLQYEKTHSTRSDYWKGLLNPTPSTSKGDNHDHSYSKEYQCVTSLDLKKTTTKKKKKDNIKTICICDEELFRYTPVQS